MSLCASGEGPWDWRDLFRIGDFAKSLDIIG